MINLVKDLPPGKVWPTWKLNDIYFWGSAQSTFQQSPEVFKGYADWAREIKNNTSQLTPNFLKNYEKYLEVSQSLGQNMFRLSLEISHLCPRFGEFNEKMMEKYVEIILNIKRRGQEPMVTLFHWTLPDFLTSSNQENAWDHPKILEHFFYYIEKVSEYLKDKNRIREVMRRMNMPTVEQEQFLSSSLVKYFISLNEPSTYNLNSFILGVFPPYKKLRIFKFEATLNKWVKIHDRMYEKFGRYNNNNSQIGLSHNWTYFEGPLGYILQKLLNERTMNKFERINGDYSDFFSLQYYCRFKFVPYLIRTFGPKSFEKFLREYDFGSHPDFGDIYPEGIRKHLIRMHEMYPNKELWVTEFGLADSPIISEEDIRGPWHLFETVREILTTVSEGVPIKGVLLWSLITNYEWEQGMKVNFGLLHEEEIFQPLKGGLNYIRRWQAWRAILNWLHTGSSENLEFMRNKAYEQYSQAA